MSMYVNLGEKEGLFLDLIEKTLKGVTREGKDDAKINGGMMENTKMENDESFVKLLK